MTTGLLSAPWETFVVCLLLLVAPAIATGWRRSVRTLVALVIAAAVALFAPAGPLAYGAVAIGALLHAFGAWPSSRTGAVWLTASALLAVATGAALDAGRLTEAFVLSTLAIALRAGVLPLNAGVSSLCERAPIVQIQQLASTIVLVFVHLRFVDHHPEAVALAPLVVRIGAVAALAGALLSIVQRDLRGFYRATTSMHGGLVLAAVGAASHDNFAAALLVVVSAGLALGGLGIMTSSLEERVGAVRFEDGGGRVGALPRLAVAYAFFGAAGVAMPGTSGFVADDLLLHALWMESPVSTVLVIVSSATLAVSTLVAYSRAFLGRPVPVLAPDLSARERLVTAALFGFLLVLGLAPGLLIGPADAFLTVVPEVATVAPGAGAVR
ncbi:MAG: proton-conducting transporter membrane subunit [Vicinamibacterales bacterium]